MRIVLPAEEVYEKTRRATLSTGVAYLRINDNVVSVSRSLTGSTSKSSTHQRSTAKGSSRYVCRTLWIFYFRDIFVRNYLREIVFIMVKTLEKIGKPIASPYCIKCCKIVPHNTVALICDFCNKPEHAHCNGLSSEDFLKLSSIPSDSVLFVCSICKPQRRTGSSTNRTSTSVPANRRCTTERSTTAASEQNSKRLRQLTGQKSA